MGMGGNGNSPHGKPMGIGISQKKMEMGMGGNGNWIDGNGREWECWKPFPHISSGQHRITVFVTLPVFQCIGNATDPRYSEVFTVCWQFYSSGSTATGRWLAVADCDSRSLGNLKRFNGWGGTDICVPTPYLYGRTCPLPSGINANAFHICKWSKSYRNKQEAQLMLTNPHDAFRGQGHQT